MTATAFNQKTIDEFHARSGRGVAPWGDNLLLMTSKGSKTGTEITTPLVHRLQGEDCIVVASKGGAPEDPGWLANVVAHPVVDVERAGPDGIERFQARPRVVAGGEERDRLYALMTEAWPAFADYQKKTTRVIPVVVLERIK